jgi:phage-related protein
MLISQSSAWTITYYDELLRNEIERFPEDILSDYLRLIGLMELGGANLGMPYTRAMGQKLFELRLHGKEGAGRVLYCTLKGKRIVMLHSFIKKTRQTLLKDLRIARRRLEEVQENG